MSTTHLRFGSPDETARFAASLARHLNAGDVILLEGDLGAGKSHFARALIQSKLGRQEDVPSPTFTLLQTYDADCVELWHADLYRLSGEDEIIELGLDLAFDSAICLVEWPDRLGSHSPKDALTVTLAATSDPDARDADLSYSHPKWRTILGHG